MMLRHGVASYHTAGYQCYFHLASYNGAWLKEMEERKMIWKLSETSGCKPT